MKVRVLSSAPLDSAASLVASRIGRVEWCPERALEGRVEGHHSVYILECRDKTHHVGHPKDLAERARAHGTGEGANYSHLTQRQIRRASRRSAVSIPSPPKTTWPEWWWSGCRQRSRLLAPNMIVKIPATHAGIAAIEEATARASASMLPSRTRCPKCVAVAEAVERGLTRRELERTRRRRHRD